VDALPDREQRMSERRFLFLLASARSGGNSEILARLAAEALPTEVLQDWRDLRNANLPPFEDLRHAGEYGPVEGVSADLAEATLAATDIVFVAPLYWYGLPSLAKLCLDHWTHWMRAPGLDFKAHMANKTLWLVMAHSGSNAEQIATGVDTLRFSANYLSMRWGGALLGDANAPGDIAHDDAALQAAKTFFASDAGLGTVDRGRG
jgi:NAD(P)H-dependent FMN reductase